MLRGATLPACRYLYAWCAVQLDRLLDAEAALRAVINDMHARDMHGDPEDEEEKEDITEERELLGEHKKENEQYLQSLSSTELPNNSQRNTAYQSAKLGVYLL